MYFLTWLARFLSEEFGLETRTPLKMYDTLYAIGLVSKELP